MESNKNKNLGVVSVLLFGLVFYLGFSLFLVKRDYDDLQESTSIKIRNLQEMNDELEMEIEDYDRTIIEKEMEIKYWGILYQQMKLKFPKEATKIENDLIL